MLQGRLPPRLFTVGRLDVASTGLIFVTNDGRQQSSNMCGPHALLPSPQTELLIACCTGCVAGHWANQVIHPSGNLTKEYLVLVDKAPTQVQVGSRCLPGQPA
jgi:16S rRNA U516 pseudouridylate synthase RsuA-like enzyme